jgi:hypothetical protein
MLNTGLTNKVPIKVNPSIVFTSTGLRLNIVHSYKNWVKVKHYKSWVKVKHCA